MSCGVPCVATNVGESSTIVGCTGWVVPADNEDALASAMAELLAMPRGVRNVFGLKARQRILENYSLEAMAEAYTKLYEATVTA